MRESRHPTMAHALAVLAAHDDALLHANSMPMDTASSSTKVNCRKRTSLKCANSPVPTSTPMKNGGGNRKLGGGRVGVGGSRRGRKGRPAAPIWPPTRGAIGGAHAQPQRAG